MGGGGIAPPFLTSALDGGERPGSRPRQRAPGTDLIGGSVTQILFHCGAEKFLFPPPGIEPQSSTPLAIRYAV
jgi:hypothetical protein